jgi:hypothetical protein
LQAKPLGSGDAFVDAGRAAVTATRTPIFEMRGERGQ